MNKPMLLVAHDTCALPRVCKAYLWCADMLVMP